MHTIRYAICLASGLGLLAGCNANPQAPAHISGTVTYKGNPVPGGTVLFHSAELGVYNATLGADGTYDVRDVPKGKLVVTIETESLNPAHKKAPAYGGGLAGKADVMKPPPGSGASADKYVKIPAKYMDPEKTPLSIEASAGAQVQNFTLTDD